MILFYKRKGFKIKGSISSENVNDVVLSIVIDYVTSKPKDIFKIIEFGAGSGAFSTELRDVLNQRQIKYEIDCYDIEPEQINKNDSLGFKCDYLDAQKKFTFAKKYDIIISVELIEHIENPFHFVRELAKISEMNGLLVLTTPNVLSLSSRFRYFCSGCVDYFRRPYNEYWLNMGHLNPINPIQLIYLLRKNGFKVLDLFSNKAVFFSKLLLPLVPILYLYSYFHFVLREKGIGQKKRNKNLLEYIFSLDMLLGKIIIFKIQKEKEIIATQDIWHTGDKNFEK